MSNKDPKAKRKVQGGKANSISELWKGHNHKVYFVIITIVVLWLSIKLPSWIHLPQQISPDTKYYILSSIAQGLIAVFVLIITIPLLLFSVFKDNSKIRRLSAGELRWSQILFYILVLGTIMLSLWLLYIEHAAPWLVNFCLGLTASCLVGVIISAWAFKKRVDNLTRK